MNNNQVDIAISVKSITKHFGQLQALSEVNFEVHRGEIFGFLGPNGAGKTTTINILTGLARADSGKIYIDGIDCIKKPRAAQNRIGVVPDENNLYPELTGYENLCFCAALYGIRKKDRQFRARELLETFNLKDAADRKFAGYSKGMKRKLTIAAGIIHKPEILFLDEPTTGIDVGSARQLRNLVADLNKNGTTIFLTTHYIEEAERLCNRIAFIVSGKIVRIDLTENLLQPLQNKLIVQISCLNLDGRIADKIAENFPKVTSKIKGNNRIIIESDEPVRVGAFVRFLEENQVEVTEARKIQPSLEDIFVDITGLEASLMQKEKEKQGGGK